MIKRQDVSIYLFDLIRTSSVPYALMRDIERTLNDQESKDFDLAVEMKNINQIKQLFSNDTNINVIYTNRRSYCLSIGMVLKLKDGFSFFSVDLIHKFSIYGVDFFDMKMVLADHTEQYLFHGRTINILSSRMNSAVKTVPECFFSYIERNITTEEREFIQSYLLPNFMMKDYPNSNPKFQLKTHSILMNSVKILRHVFQEFFGYYARTKFFSIAVLGPDGAGKSTVIDSIFSEISKAFVQSQNIHLKPNLFFNRRYEKRGVVTDPHSKSQRGIFLSLIKIILWLIELTYFNHFTKRQNQTLVIFDRFLSDVLVDPCRYRIKKMSVFLNLCKLFPPDLTIILVADANIIYGRKQETTFSVLERSLLEYSQLNHKLGSPTLTVNNEYDLDDAVLKIYNYLFERRF